MALKTTTEFFAAKDAVVEILNRRIKEAQGRLARADIAAWKQAEKALELVKNHAGAFDAELGTALANLVAASEAQIEAATAIKAEVAHITAQADLLEALGEREPGDGSQTEKFERRAGRRQDGRNGKKGRRPQSLATGDIAVEGYRGASVVGKVDGVAFSVHQDVVDEWRAGAAVPTAVDRFLKAAAAGGHIVGPEQSPKELPAQ